MHGLLHAQIVNRSACPEGVSACFLEYFCMLVGSTSFCAPFLFPSMLSIWEKLCL